MINYLRITRLPVGVILNFKRSRLEWKRVILQGEQSSADNGEIETEDS